MCEISLFVAVTDGDSSGQLVEDVVGDCSVILVPQIHGGDKLTVVLEDRTGGPETGRHKLSPGIRRDALLNHDNSSRLDRES